MQDKLRLSNTIKITILLIGESTKFKGFSLFDKIFIKTSSQSIAQIGVYLLAKIHWLISFYLRIGCARF